MANDVLRTHDLSKAFGEVVAVRGLTLSLRPGEAFGCLGQNGAGKTTFVKMLLGLVAPTSGSGILLGAPLGDRAARRDVGFLPEHFRFHDWLTASELLELHGRLFGVDRPTLLRRSDALLDRVGLATFRHRRLRTFSKGMLQRIGIAQALIGEPRLVFLDEPTSGLDPVGRLLVRDLIGELKRGGTTVFLNSHLLGEVEASCDRVAFVKHGEALRVGDLGSLVEGETELSIRAGELDPETLFGLGRFGRPRRTDSGEIVLAGVSDRDVPEIARWLVGRGAELRALVPRRPSLEEIFLRILGRDGGL
ncbi:MAG: ABC transporter ATP-binding protein [Acidobacteriia bacterium]|nr:ABC transporter ATP-binding protein [Terriglobia bacterium]